MKSVWFGGGEVSAHRKVLARHGVRKLAFNVHPVITSRSGNAGEQTELEPYSTVFYSSQTVDDEAFAEIVEGYADHRSIVVGMQFDKISEAVCIPRWNGAELEEFYELASKHHAVFMDEADAGIQSNARPLTAWYRRNPNGRIFTPSSKVNVVSLPFVTDPLVTGWVAAQKHRELQVWDGSKVKRSPRASKAKVVDKLYGQIESMGVVPDLLIDDDPDEAVKLAVKSWLMYESVVTNDEDDGMSEDVQSPGRAPTNVAVARVRERKLIPVMEMRTLNVGDESERSVVVPSASTLHHCDDCSVTSACPQYQPGFECAWTFPVQIRSMAQRVDMNNMLMELRVRRLFRALAEEELLGDGLSPEVSREFDGIARQMKLDKELHEVTETVTIKATTNASASRPGGLLTRFFGESVGAATNRELPPVIDADSAVLDDSQAVPR